MNSRIWQFETTLTNRLLVWSILSVLFGLAACFASDNFLRGFGIQGVVWGLIDFAIAFLGAKSAARRKSTADPMREAQSIRKILWVNFGLDVLYILAGFFIIQNYTEAFWLGTGWGIILQGAFLFFFDLIHALSVPNIEAI